MRPRTFEYFKANSVADALQLLRSKDDAKVLAGGQSLLSLMKLRLAAPKVLVDINEIPELSNITERDGSVVIGSMSRHDQVARSHTIQNRLPLLADAASLIADQQVRNRGTIGGSLVHADPAADFPTACKALGATLTVMGAKGSRSISIESFFSDCFTTSLERGEIVTEVRIPMPPAGSGGAYLKLNRGHNDFAIVAVGAQLLLDNTLVCKEACVVLGGVATTPVHATETERALKGRKLDHNAIQDASDKASNGLNPNSDLHASAEYRNRMTRSLTLKTLELATKRSQGGQ